MSFVSADSYYVKETPTSIADLSHRASVVSEDADDMAVRPPARILNKVPLNIVQDQQERRYLVTKWLEIITYTSEGIYFARNDRLNLFGDGFTEREAIEDLSGQIAYSYQFYKDLDPAEATRDALEFKQRYSNLLIELRENRAN